jgi:hypothetical protein
MRAQKAALTPAIAMPEAAVAKAMTAGMRSSASAGAAGSDAATVVTSASPATQERHLRKPGAQASPEPRSRSPVRPGRFLRWRSPAPLAVLAGLRTGCERGADRGGVDGVSSRGRSEHSPDASHDHRAPPGDHVLQTRPGPARLAHARLGSAAALPGTG